MKLCGTWQQRQPGHGLCAVVNDVVETWWDVGTPLELKLVNLRSDALGDNSTR